MDVALLVARLILALVFLVAGFAKLADRSGSRQAIIDFGLPVSLASLLGLLLPLAELVVAALLLVTRSAWLGAIGAGALLLAFIAGISINLAQGRRPDCHCFGQLESEPVGGRTLARNIVLLGVASFVAWQGRSDAGPGVLSWLGHTTTAEGASLVVAVVALALVALQAWFLLHLAQQNGRLLVRLERIESSLSASGVAAAPEPPVAVPAPGLRVGTPAPSFALAGLYGETQTLDALRAHEKPVILTFTDPGCGPCTELLPDIGRWQQEYADKLSITLVSRGTIEANRPKVTEHGVTNVLLQQDWEIGQAYLMPGTPSAVVVGTDGTIQSPTVSGPDAIRNLLAQTLGLPMSAPIPLLQQAPSLNAANNGHGRPSAPVLQAGLDAPSLALPDLSGQTVRLEDLRGSNTLILFWNPQCGFCKRMLPEIRAWEEKKPAGAPNLLVVSTGTIEDNLEMGFQSPVVLDPSLTGLQAFGAAGTPTGVLVDADGKVASNLAVGAVAVLELAAGAATKPIAVRT
jgi:thiol-disulfide isomerase/thioredoxin/uncharacterized membrane protein YphA (DoxX/SURF4 family)